MRKALLVASVCMALRGLSYAGTALDKPAFIATPAELLAEAKAAPPGDWPAVNLRVDHDIKLDARGRGVHRFRFVFVIRSQVGVNDWGTISWSWSPFYQDKPVVKARVIQPDGTAMNLDPTTMSDAPVVEASPSVFSDRRRLNAPLPRLQIGTVVEEEVVITDREAILGTFGDESAWLRYDVPTVSARVTISAPVASKARIVVRGLSPKLRPRHEIKAGIESWSYDAGAIAAEEDRDLGIPSDLYVFPRIGVTTAPSWGALSTAYRKVVDKRISDGPVSLPAGLPRTPSVETIKAIVAWLHQQVRYTGIEFGEASNVPWPPAETLKRGFGDCKDKATLLVALLRQVGIRADLALIYDGTGLDIDADLPAMGVFDHAIVRARLGATDVWIDATEEQTAVGHLPIRDQGRRALVIADDVTALVTTPRFDDTKIREVRAYTIAETGPTRLLETSTRSGVAGVTSREWVRDHRADEVRKSLTSYADSEYKGSLESYSAPLDSDLSKPFELKIEVAGTDRVAVMRDRVALDIYTSDVFAELPDYLTDKPDAGEKPRRVDYEWRIPHVFEIEHRYVLPPGFAPPSPEPTRARKLGTATVTDEVSVDGQTVVVTQRFESGKRRISATEVTELRKAIRDAYSEHRQIISAHRAWTAHAKGQSKDAIAEVERLIKLHPKEAIHHVELAQMYLFVGAGAAARREAAKAVQLEPKYADAHAVQAWVLRHDTLGIDFGFDHDRSGALAAYAKARALDPKHVGAAVDYATALERDTEGRITRIPADLHAAAEAWKVAHALDDTNENRSALIRALLRDGRAAEAESVAGAANSGTSHEALLVAATAFRDPKKAFTLASSLRSGGERTNLLNRAGAELYSVRKYDSALALQVESGSIRPGSLEYTMSSKLSKHDEKLVIAKDPKRVASDVVLSMLDTRYIAQSVLNEHVRDALRKSLKTYRTKLASLQRLGPGTLRDLAFSGLDATVEGGASGPWHVEIDFYGQKFPILVGLQGGEAKLLGMAEASIGVGMYALDRIAARDPASARQLVDWLISDMQRFGSKSKLVKVWGTTLPKNDKTVGLVAAILAEGRDPARSIAFLEKCDSTDVDVRLLCDMGLLLAYDESKRYAELERHGAAWAKRDPSSDLATLAHAAAFMELKRYDEADALASAMLAKNPNSYAALFLRAYTGIRRGVVDEAMKRLDALTRSSVATAKDKNNHAWYLLAVNRELNTALELVSAAIRDDASNATAFDTRAAIEAEMGDLKLAIADVWRSMDARDGREPNFADWYVVGRIHEQLGLRDDAAAAYRRVKRKPDDDPPSSYELAQARLKLLGKP